MTASCIVLSSVVALYPLRILILSPPEAEEGGNGDGDAGTASSLVLLLPFRCVCYSVVDIQYNVHVRGNIQIE